MSDNTNPFGFGKFVPGFDFLQNLAKGGAQAAPQIPGMSSWVAPTLSVEELDKRIAELKAVQFWLDQNAVALKATIQALEVQKMTLATLKGMNFNMGEVAKAFMIKLPEAAGFGGMLAPAAAPASAAPAPREKAAAPQEAPEEDASAEPEQKKTSDSGGSAKSGKTASAAANGVVDPMQWWGSLTQQFQEIASSAVKDAAGHPGMDAVRNLAASFAKPPAKAPAVRPAATATAKKAAARKRAR